MIEFDCDEIGLIGDLHLGKSDSDEWCVIFDDLNKFIKDTYKGKVETLMFLGDIFDGHKSKTTEKAISFKMLNFVVNFFEELTKDFKIIMYSGNHCCYYKDRCDVSAISIFRGKKNITVIEKTTKFSHNGKDYAIVPWACDISAVGKVDGIFGHFDIQTFKFNNVKISEHGYSSKELFKFCDNVYTGHYHHYQQRYYNKKTKSITYLGTPLQLNWGESGKESFLFFFDLSLNKITKMVTNSVSPQFVKVSASTILEGKKLDNSFVSVEWDIDHDEDTMSKINNKLSNNENLSIRHQFDSKRDVSVGEIADIHNSADIREILASYVDATWMKDENDLKLLLDRANSYIDRTTHNN